MSTFSYVWSAKYLSQKSGRQNNYWILVEIGNSDRFCLLTINLLKSVIEWTIAFRIEYKNMQIDEHVVLFAWQRQLFFQWRCESALAEIVRKQMIVWKRNMYNETMSSVGCCACESVHTFHKVHRNYRHDRLMSASRVISIHRYNASNSNNFLYDFYHVVHTFTVVSIASPPILPGQYLIQQNLVVYSVLRSTVSYSANTIADYSLLNVHFCLFSHW